MSEETMLEDGAEKLAERGEIVEYLNELGPMSKEKLVEFLMEKFGLSRDEAEKLFEDLIEKGMLRYDKTRRGYIVAQAKSGYRIPRLKILNRFPRRRLAKARIDSVIKLPPDAHTLPNKSHFLARDWHPYYHPAMDKDKLAYLKARERMGEGADWPA